MNLAQWKRRIQQFSLKTKIVIPMVLLASFPALAIGLFVLSYNQQLLDQLTYEVGQVNGISANSPMGQFLIGAHQDLNQMMLLFSTTIAFVVVLSAGIGFLIALYLVRPVAILRKATQEIARGNLTRSVDIKTGDEIEGLANDFNVMTKRLQKAQEQLEKWNQKLAEEITKQTQSLQFMQRNLARVDKLATIGQMTSGIMHEIGNPLAAMKTSIQVAQQENEVCKQNCSVLPILLDEVNRLTMFLRSFSRLGRLGKAHIEQLSLEKIVPNIISLLEPEMHRRKVTLEFTTPSELPLIWGDADQIRQVLVNLILNAADASADGDKVGVTIHPATAKTITIEVADQGEGMSEEILEKIWDPFYTTKSEGTGLGLAICRRIIEDHEGSITIASQVGQGSRVRVHLPICKQGER